ncbi:LysR family transcriptional regulator [Pelotomaculum propionicicum]|uniref:Hydrogen peroxide-inducible genes activator n=1 Tax=Pelotomaculum propionicicum TaxID=258475 RepID=A0A4Y7RIT4_9FIRM|nr:LysR family transcriptional regulator [Pelotomaculum propionicicum]TEB08711.1 Hydrogen peroxide-inducible genes activator [Pelotomaculum propionicicum]
MRLQQLEYFVEVVRCKSMSQAAKNLFITQPALSVAIKDFEKTIGVQLIKRSNKGVVPTTLGKQIFNDSQEIINIYKGWPNASGSGDICGDVYIFAIPSICNSILFNESFFNLKKMYPKLNIFLDQVRPHELLSHIIKNYPSIGIGYYLPSERESLFSQAKMYGLKTELLFKDEFNILISNKNPLAQKDKLSLSDLKKLPLSYYSDTNDNISLPYQMYFDDSFRFRLNSKENIMELIVHNKAVALYPEKASRYEYCIRSNLVRPMSVENFRFPQVEFFILYPAKKTSSIGLMKVVDNIKENLSDF